MLNDLVINHNGQPVTTSRLVALKFGKRHTHVLEAIRNLECTEDFAQPNFRPSSYLNEQNRNMPEYVISRDGFTYLVMGFTGKEAAKFKEEFIRAFVQMESKLKSLMPKTQAEMLLQSVQLLVQQESRLTSVEKQVKELKAQTIVTPDYFTIAGYGSLNHIEVNIKMASSLGKKASRLCKELGIEPDRISDPRFGYVNAYPRHILEEVFNMAVNA